MYKLIITDDEERIRTSLSEVINWNSIGFEIIGLFSNGQEVIDFIQYNHVDCILCDIKMNSVSGIDLAKYVYNNKPQIKIMFISGYQEFSYASAAISYGVENYFLKPVKIDEIKNAFIALKNKLDYEKNTSEIVSCYKRDILQNLVNGIYKDEHSIKQAFSKIQLNVHPSYSCALLDIVFNSETAHDINSLSNFFQNIALFKQTSLHLFYLSNDSDHVKYILFSDIKNHDTFINFAKDICVSITEISGLSASIANLEYFDSVLELCENSSITDFKSDVKLSYKDEQLISAISSSNYDVISKILVDISGYTANLNIDEMRNYYYDLLTKSFETLSDITNNMLNKNLLKKHIKAIEHSSDAETMNSIAETCLYELTQMMNDTDLQKKNILRIRDYIATHCTEDLSLEQVAALAYLSPTWFSKVFKKIVGQTYIDFLITCKINKAKDLLINSQMKIHEVSDAIGYRNTRSFTKLFRSFCGITPSEYRNKFAKDI